MKTISIVNQKGGVGKTTTTMNIGAALHRLGRKVLLINLDPQGNLSTYLGWEQTGQDLTANDLIYFAASGRPLPENFAQVSAEGIDYIPANRLLASAVSILGTDPDSQGVLARLLKEPPFQTYDYILIDCKPSLDLLVTNALAASDSVLVPVQAELFALTAVGEVMETVRRTKAYIPDWRWKAFCSPCTVPKPPCPERCGRRWSKASVKLSSQPPFPFPPKLGSRPLGRKASLKIRNWDRNTWTLPDTLKGGPVDGQHGTEHFQIYSHPKARRSI